MVPWSEVGLKSSIGHSTNTPIFLSWTTRALHFLEKWPLHPTLTIQPSQPSSYTNPRQGKLVWPVASLLNPECLTRAGLWSIKLTRLSLPQPITKYCNKFYVISIMKKDRHTNIRGWTWMFWVQELHGSCIVH